MRVRPSYSSEYSKYYRKFQYSHNHTFCANYAEKFTEPRIDYLEGKDVQNSQILKLAISMPVVTIVLLIALPVAQPYILSLYERT